MPKFYQDTTLGYQDAYETLCIQQEELQHRYTQQAQLVEEASKALQAVEAESSARHKEYVALQNQQEAEIQQAIGEAVSQYQHQLSSVQSSLQRKDKEYQHSIQKLQDQVWVLELSLAGQATLPSVVPSISRPGLHQEVFNILPGTVNQWRGAAQYESQDQAFSFHKQVQFEDNNSSPKLKPGVESGEVGQGTHNLLMHQGCPIFQRYQSILLHHIMLPMLSQVTEHSTVSPMAPLVQDSKDAAMIAAEVSAATTAASIKGVPQDAWTQNHKTKRWVFSWRWTHVQILEVRHLGTYHWPRAG